MDVALPSRVGSLGLEAARGGFCSFVLVFKTRLAPVTGGTRWTFFLLSLFFLLLVIALAAENTASSVVSSLEICARCLFRFTNQPTIGGLSPPACLPP